MTQPYEKQSPPEVETSGSILKEIEAGADQRLLEIGRCVEDRHPTLTGRVRVETQAKAFWVLCLSTAKPRIGDRVILARVGADDERVVMGVIDGVRERVAPGPNGRHVRRVREGEAVVIEAADGKPIVEMRVEGERTVLKLLSNDVGIESAGHLELKGESIALRSTKGPIELQSSEDVRVAGETIQLN